MNIQFIKMQSENIALILFICVIAAILGAIIAVLSHYPPPAYILGSTALGVAVGGIISARREARFIASLPQVEMPKTSDDETDPPEVLFHYPDSK